MCPVKAAGYSSHWVYWGVFGFCWKQSGNGTSVSQNMFLTSLISEIIISYNMISGVVLALENPRDMQLVTGRGKAQLHCLYSQGESRGEGKTPSCAGPQGAAALSPWTPCRAGSGLRWAWGEGLILRTTSWLDRLQWGVHLPAEGPGWRKGSVLDEDHPRDCRGCQHWESAAGCSEKGPMPTAGSRLWETAEPCGNPSTAHGVVSSWMVSTMTDKEDPTFCPGWDKSSGGCAVRISAACTCGKKIQGWIGFWQRSYERTLEEEVCDTTFAAADGLIISAAHQSLTTTTTASPTSFPRALLPVLQWLVAFHKPLGVTTQNLFSGLCLCLAEPAEPCIHSPGTSLLPWGRRWGHLALPGHWEGQLGTSWSHKAAWQEERGSSVAAEGSHQSAPCPNIHVHGRTRVLAPCTALGNVRTSPPGWNVSMLSN